MVGKLLYEMLVCRLVSNISFLVTKAFLIYWKQVLQNILMSIIRSLCYKINKCSSLVDFSLGNLGHESALLGRN